jgi:hypothetical protein
MLINNAAARLYDILNQARAEFNPKQHKVTIRQVWASVLKIETEDFSEVLHFVAHLLDLVRTAKLHIQELPDVNSTIYLRPFENIEMAFGSMNLDEPWNRFTQHLDEATMVGLQFCADTLSLARPEAIISEEELAALQSDIEVLIEKVVQSELPSHAKTMFLNNLENIRLAILEYRINGSAGLSRALDLSLGGMLRHQDDLENAKDEEIFPAFFRIMIKINDLVTYARNLKQLLDPVMNYFLPSLPSGD